MSSLVCVFATLAQRAAWSFSTYKKAPVFLESSLPREAAVKTERWVPKKEL
jgi:hypothetical protein